MGRISDNGQKKWGSFLRRGRTWRGFSSTGVRIRRVRTMSRGERMSAAIEEEATATRREVKGMVVSM